MKKLSREEWCILAFKNWDGSIYEIYDRVKEGSLPELLGPELHGQSKTEPKRWTVEDQKAGRLPEVGAELLHESEGCVNFVGEFDFRWMLRTKEGGLYLAEKFYCSPIETPEEKAERLREEWCRKALDSAGLLSEMKRYDLKRLSEYIGSIHDALLSGTLSVPTKGGE